MSSSKEIATSSWPLSTKSTMMLIGAGGVIGIGAFIYKVLNAPDSGEGGSFEQMFKPPAPVEGEEAVGPSSSPDDWKFARHGPAPGTIPILILYGTEYGCSQDIAKNLEKEIYTLEGGKYFPRVVDMEDYELLELHKEQVIIVVTSTYGDGVPPTRARKFFDYIEANRLELSKAQFSVLALGDSSYPYFCRAGKTVDRLFEEFGAKRFYRRSDIDCEDWGVIDKWCGNVIEGLPKLTLTAQDDYLWPKVGDYKENDAYSRKKPFFAKLTIKDTLTQQLDKEDKETIHFEFDLEDSGISYVVGDSLGVLPTNDPTHIDELLQVLNIDGKQLINMPSWKYEVPSIPSGKQGPIREVLMYFYDIKNLKPKVLQLLLTEGQKQNKTKEVERLQQLLEKGTGKENTILTEYFHGREAIDVMSEFASIKVPINDLLAALGQLLPRYYSISSSMLQDSKKVTITVAVVRYVTHGKSRKGVTSTHLSDDIIVGHRVPIFVNNNPDFRLPSDPTVPILMIGPGTGVAPFRAMLQERVKSNSTGENILYFGCRMSTRDFLYKEELESLHNDKKLILHTAFSRDQEKKVYVQHVLASNAENVWNLIQNGGHVYVCGDAQYMEKDVYQTLVEIASNYGKMDKEEAEKYIQSLEHSKRYQKDTWF